MNFISIKRLFILFCLIAASLFIISAENIYAQVEISPIKIANDKEVCNLNAGKFYWVIYDSVCPYCRSARKHIKSLDWQGKFKFISYRDPITYKMFPNLTKEECAKDVHMVTPTGEVLVGYEVFRTIIDNLTATKVLNPLLKNDYAEKQLREIYEKMVKERSCYYSKTGTCTLKSKPDNSKQ